MSNNLIERTLNLIKHRKQKIHDGGINCIPIPFKRFSSEWPGIEQKQIIQITGSTKAGKSQCCDGIFLYPVVKYALDNPDKIRIKIFYFTLEMSAEQKMLAAMSHILWMFSKGSIRITPRELRSVGKELPQDIIDILETSKYQDYLKFFEDHVTFIDSIRNPFGIFRFMRDYATANGIQHKKIIPIIDNQTKESKDVEVDDFYEPNDQDEYVFCIVDHMSLITPEKGYNLKESIDKLSSEYFVNLRNKYKYIIVPVIQQQASQESNENFKLGKLKPTLDGYAESKTQGRDCDMALGIYSPYRHQIPDYEGYDIRKLKDNCRFLEIIAGREGGGGNICPLFFDGGTNYFEELPLPNDTAGLQQVYKLCEKVRK